MAKLVTYEEIDLSTPRAVAVSATALELSSTRLGKTRRKSIVIIPTTGAIVVTVVKADSVVGITAGVGIVLTANQSYAENDDAKSDCWQGAIQVIANGAGSVSVTETFEAPGKL